MYQRLIVSLCLSGCLQTPHAATLTMADLLPGDLLITEYLANPVNASDAGSEYFELYNSRADAVDLSGLRVRDEGSNQFVIAGLVIPAGGLAVLSNGDGAALGFSPDYQYSGMTLGNTADEILLLGSGDTLLQRLDYGDGDAFGAGVAHELAQLLPGQLGLAGPPAGMDFIAASLPLAAGNVGSPGSFGNSLPAIPLPPAAWLFATALGLLGICRRQACLACARLPAGSCPGDDDDPAPAPAPAYPAR